MQGLCLGPWAEANVFEILAGGMWVCVVGDHQDRQSPRWGPVGPLITVLGAEVTMGVLESELPT